MHKYTIEKIDELNTLLYNSYIHDAQIERIYCDIEEKQLEIELINHFFKKKYNFVFYLVDKIFSVRGTNCGCRESVNTLTITKDTIDPNLLHLTFHMISEDELHIACRDVIIKTQ